MRAENLIENYLEKIIYVENNTTNFQRKVVLPNNSINLMFQFGKTVFENCNEKQLPLDLSVILLLIGSVLLFLTSMAF